METQIFIRALMIHLVVDWFLQNDWMAANKAKLGHPAGIIHAAIHAIGLTLVFPVEIALLIGITHYVIDLRFLLKWWRETYRQTIEGPAALHVAIWGDQVAHIIILWLVAWFIAVG